MDAASDRAHVGARDVRIVAPLDGVAFRDHAGDDDRPAWIKPVCRSDSRRLGVRQMDG